MNRKKRKSISPPAYSKRVYRETLAADGFVSSFVTVRETDLHILASADASEPGYDAVHRYRNQLENYIGAHPGFLTSLVPLEQDPLAPAIIRGMLAAAAAAGVGPMAAVAGAIAEFVGRDLLGIGLREVTVENGGDIFLKRDRECVAAIFAGQSPLSNKVGIRVPPGRTPAGLCTSSGTVGHSLSLGEADSVTVLAPSALLADAAATRLGNEVAAAPGKDIAAALEIAGTIVGLLGVVIICGGEMGVWGELDLVGLH